MQDHLTADDLQRFRRGAMSPAETSAAGRHLAECAECARRGAELAARVAAPGWLARAVGGESEHPESDAIIGFVDGALDGERRRAVEHHLSVCATCRREVADLQTVRDELSPGRPRVRIWVVAGAAAAAAAAAIVIAVTAIVLHRSTAPSPRVTPMARGHEEPPRSAEADALVAQALAGRLERPRLLDDLRPRADVPRDALPPHGGAGVSMTPVGVVVESQTPEFAWTAKGRSYAVTITDRSRITEQSGTLAAPRWKPAQPLRRGRTYEWQVEVHDSGTYVIPAPPAPPAFFRVIDAQSWQRIEEARRTRPADHLLAGVLYARAGMQREAEQELSLYAAQHPGDANARGLLETIRSW